MLSVYIDIIILYSQNYIGGLAKMPFFGLADFNLAVCSSTHIPNTCTHTRTKILVDFNLAVHLVNCQSAKLNYVPNFTVSRSVVTYPL